ncbi:hypothetical protein [Polaribacter sp. HL-MS24]|uniref:hypothetical protein n=1 Tax=Polaribacter sp. HL-MS24 TaxID=3077735 RepID=UPI002934A621|nr:hypothetical protein [Polaribacter sp. HL-MS24]WOC40194.1 hypothetical protein RRF69_11405 [Polaribacter sp. HL-MS24]
MKNLKIIIAVVSIALLTTFSLQATEKNNSKSNNELRAKIVAVIGTKMPIHIKKESTATISFIMNTKNELVILNIDSDNEEVSSYIKNKLNYKKMDVEGTLRGETYSLTFKVKVKN